MYFFYCKSSFSLENSSCLIRKWGKKIECTYLSDKMEKRRYWKETKFVLIKENAVLADEQK